MRFLSIKNIERFQHYKDRSPPWIKLHASTLADYAFSCLQDASKAHLMLLWLLASKLDNRIPWDEEWLGKQLMATERVDVQVLIDQGFVIVEQDDSTALAPRKQSAMPETERETESEREKKDSSAPFVTALTVSSPHPEKNGTRASRAVRVVGMSGEQVKGRISEYFETQRQKQLSKTEMLNLQVDVAFAYWAAKHNHPRAILDAKRSALVRRRLEENQGDLSELLFAIDGALRDKHLTENGYDMLTTILRDRQQVERLAGLIPKYQRGEMHNMAAKILGQSTDSEPSEPLLQGVG